MDESAARNAGSPRSRSLRSAVLLVIAVGIGYSLSLLAPTDWPTGQGSIVLADGGETVIDATVQVGGRTSIALSASVDPFSYTLTLPDGVPVDNTVEATIVVTELGGDQPERSDDITLTLDLPDGRSEAIPVVGFDEDAGALIAKRRPPVSGALALGLLGFVAVLWVTEAFPLYVTSLSIPVILVVSGAVDAAAATAPFFNPIIVLFFAGFLMARAMARSRLDHRVAVAVTAGAGNSPKMLFAAMLGIAAAMSMFMSNTAAAAVLIPIAVAISEPLRSKPFRAMLVIGIAYASTIGGVGSAIGTPANQLAIEFLAEFGDRTITFAEWFLFGVPMLAVFLPVTGLYLWLIHRPTVDGERFAATRRAALAERRTIGRPDREQTTVLVVFAGVMVGWLTQGFHGVHPGIVALAGAVVLFAIGRLVPEDLGRISWSSLLTFGGGLTLGYFLVASGTSDWIATQLTGLGSVPSWLAVTAVAAITVAVTTVASNTASAAILIPLALPLASVIGVEPTMLVVVVAIASSIDFALVVGTPPTMIAYSTGLFTAGGIFRKGIALDVIGILILGLVMTQIWGLMGIT